MALGEIENTRSQGISRLRGSAAEHPTVQPVLGGLLDRLGRTEWRRRIWHIAPGILPILLWPIPHNDPVSPTLQVLLFVLIGGIATAIFVRYRKIERTPGAEQGRNCVLGYAGTILAAIVLFPSALEIAWAIAAILAFGDGSATVGGKLFGGRTLPWNREKTWSGFFAFLIAGIPTATLMYWFEAHNVEALGPPLQFSAALTCCGVAVFAAAIAESLKSRIDDNLRVGLTALIVLPLMHGLLVGWH